MRTTNEKAIARITERFGVAEPIFTSELTALFGDLPRRTVYRAINRLVEEGLLGKHSRGVYYVPEQTRFGPVGVNDEDVIRKKYLLDDNGNTIGYYTGLTLEHQLHITMLWPHIWEIATNREQSPERVVVISNRKKVVLYRPRAKVTSDNVRYLKLLDILSNTPLDALEDFEFKNLQAFAQKVDRNELLNYVKYYPARTARAVLESEAAGVFA